MAEPAAEYRMHQGVLPCGCHLKATMTLCAEHEAAWAPQLEQVVTIDQLMRNALPKHEGSATAFNPLGVGSSPTGSANVIRQAADVLWAAGRKDQAAALHEFARELEALPVT